MKSKKGMSGWILILIVLALVGIGVGAWFLFGSDGGLSVGGSSIPSPPALPSG